MKQNLRTGPGRSGGFTLIELMVALLIVAILAAIAIPTYLDSLRKSRRADGIQALRSLQLAQERYRASNTTYGTLAALPFSSTSPNGWYTIAVTSPTATSYTATATAITGSTQVSDAAGGVSCSTLTVDQDKPQFSPAGQSACWGQ